jgi:hypothetical protein
MKRAKFVASLQKLTQLAKHISALPSRQRNTTIEGWLRRQFARRIQAFRSSTSENKNPSFANRQSFFSA